MSIISTTDQVAFRRFVKAVREQGSRHVDPELRAEAVMIVLNGRIAASEACLRAGDRKGALHHTRWVLAWFGIYFDWDLEE